MIRLRDYQEHLVGGARSAIERGISRLLVQSPAGSGKTVTSSFMVHGAHQRGMRAMFAVHREELAKQASKTFRGFGIPHGYVMSSMTMDARQSVHVAMIDTLRNRIDKVPRPDMLVVDECHHAVSPSWQKVINHYHERGTLIIGLSATPIRLDGRPLSGMFDEMILGPTVRYLIDIGSLAEYDYYRPPSLIDLTGVKSRGGDFASDQLAEVTDTPKIVGDAVEHYLRLMPGKRAIAFAVNVKHSQNVAATFKAAGVPAAHLDGETPPAVRAAIIQAFERGEILVLSNVNLFSEGFDVKACEGVLILRATQSLALHIQICGRAMRVDPANPNKRAIILDHVNNLSRHGLPDEEREWSLDGKKKRAGRKKDADDQSVKVSQCPKCYHVHQPQPTCPNCGHVYEATARKMEQVEGELIKVTPEQKAAIQRERLQRQKSARSLEDLQALEKEFGYSRGWAKHVWTARSGKALARA